jgi:hypothetical protein
MIKKIQMFLFLALLIGFAITSVNAQSSGNDTIFKINGESIAAKIVSVAETDVTFSYPGESMTIKLSKNLIKEIKYSSGRKEKFSEMVVINGEKDWEKVKLTTLTSDIEGLVKKGDLSASKTNLGPIYTPEKKTHTKLETEIRKEAAKLGAHIILLTPSNAASSEFKVTGVAYGYK